MLRNVSNTAGHRARVYVVHILLACVDGTSMANRMANRNYVSHSVTVSRQRCTESVDPPKPPRQRPGAAARKGDASKLQSAEGIEHRSMCPSCVSMYQSRLPRRALRRGRSSLSPQIVVQRRPRDLNCDSRVLLVPFWDVVQRDDHASWLVRLELGRPDPCVAHQIIRRG